MKFYEQLGFMEFCALVIAAILLGWITCWQIGVIVGLFAWYFKPVQG